MSFTSQHISYSQTKAFSAIVLDYLSGVAPLQAFYKYPVNPEGIQEAIEERKKVPCDRELLSEQIAQQYGGIELPSKLEANIRLLTDANTFTITTAHQPNIFTGHLYFIYKILHAIKLAADLNEQVPGIHFVPVYYMGSEDADLEELGEVNINGKQYKWKTSQTGAVGRMKIDKALTVLISEINAQLQVEAFGNEIMQLVKKHYVLDYTIEQATFGFVNELFAEYGLVIFLPDNPVYKKQFDLIIRRELLEQFSSRIITATINDFPAQYKVQATGRELNLFYLTGNIRQRIEKNNGNWEVVNTDIRFTEEEILQELNQHPERFSPNVILRPVFQEKLLPNIAFIGGGGELAYWLELKAVFEAVNLPFPVLILRNSFMFIPAKTNNKLQSMGLTAVELFRSEQELVEQLVKKHSLLKLELTGEKQQLKSLYKAIQADAVAIDPSLKLHVTNLQVVALKRLEGLEKKMLRAEKKKFDAQQRQLNKIKDILFPGGILQERIDNLLPFYAKWGNRFIQTVYEHSRGLEQEFCIITEQDK